ncbi:MAG: LytTR family DNA-binding domain-containing protein [Gammaproteobacteria bacterium]|nr:LytTR family DNA-binding domain-containing protein [Gammaproteobacteria bacterium]
MSIHYRALIADDEPLLRRHLNILLTNLWPQLEVVALASDGEEAWEQINTLKPELAFIDIQMPKLNGIELAYRLSRLEQPPLVVFITAYEEYAVRAFESAVVDYLLKPVDEKRLKKAIERLQQRLTQQQVRDGSKQLMLRISQLLQYTPPDGEVDGSNEVAEVPERLSWIKASKQGCVHIFPVVKVDYFLAESKYTTVCYENQEYLIRTPIVQLEQQLDPEHFWRIHRGCIVRVGGIHKVERNFDGQVSVHLQGERRLVVSRNEQWRFRQM